MASTKTASLSIRINPALKEALRAAAQQEHRSVANMVEFLIRDFCDQHNIAISTSEGAGSDNRDTAENDKDD